MKKLFKCPHCEARFMFPLRDKRREYNFLFKFQSGIWSQRDILKCPVCKKSIQYTEKNKIGLLIGLCFIPFTVFGYEKYISKYLFDDFFHNMDSSILMGILLMFWLYAYLKNIRYVKTLEK